MWTDTPAHPIGKAFWAPKPAFSPAPKCGAVGGENFCVPRLCWGRVGQKGSPRHTGFEVDLWIWPFDMDVLEPELCHTVTDSKRWLLFLCWPFSWCMQIFIGSSSFIRPAADDDDDDDDAIAMLGWNCMPLQLLERWKRLEPRNTVR